MNMPFSFSTPWALIPILLAILSRTARGATCYYPNGDPVNNNEYTPCRNSTDYTMCCRTGGLVPDTCDENGLCYNICDQMGSGCNNDPGTYWRESCTDRSWQSPYCLQHVCTDKTVNGTMSDNFPVTRCARSSKWCCGAMTAEDCCNLDANKRFELASVLSVSTTSTASNTAATETRTDAPTGSSQQTPTAAGNQEADNGGLGTTGKIGLGVGIGVGIPLVTAALVAVFLCRKKRHTTPVLAARPTRARYFEKPELDANATVAELDATKQTRPVEVEA